MSTLSSWIDPDEISELLPILLPESREEETAAVSSPTGEDDDAPGVETPESSAPPAEPAKPETAEETPAPAGEIAPPAETAEPIPAAEAATPSAPEFDFNASDGYDISPFPENRQEPAGEEGQAARQTAAVQAAETLERVRSRLNQGGLLRNAEDAASAETPAKPEAVPEAAAPPEPEAESEIPVAATKPAEEGSEPAPETPESEAVEREPGETEDSLLPPPPPGSFRDRLSRFAASAAQLTGGADPVVTDLQSYPLYLPATGGDAGKAQSIGAIVRMNQQVAGMPNQPNGGSARTSQIALSSSEWLCVLTQGSAAGQVCASLRVPEPLPSETVEELHAQLRAAIDG